MPDWRFWGNHILPDGTKLSREEWTEFCKIMLKTKLARRPYLRAAIQVTSFYGDARRSLRNVFALTALPAPSNHQDKT